MNLVPQTEKSSSASEGTDGPVLVVSAASVKHRTLRWKPFAWLALAIIAAAAIWWPRPERPIPVSVGEAANIDLKGAFTAEAYVRGRDFQLGSETSGRAVALHVREGDPVKKGDLLLSVDSDDARQVLIEAESSLKSTRVDSARASAALYAARRELEQRIKAAKTVRAQAEAGLRRARLGARPEEIAQAEHRIEKALAAQEDARKAFERSKTLVAQGAIPRASFDAAEARYTAATADVEEAKDYLAMLKSGPRPEDVELAQKALDSASASLSVVQSGSSQLEPLRLQVVGAETAVNRARSTVERARQAVRRTDLRAPADGVVTRVNIELGTVVSAGTPIITLSTRQDLHIEAEIGSEDASKIREGMAVTVTSPAYPGREFAAKLVQAMPVGELKPDAAIRTRIVRARVLLDRDWPLFRPGMEVDVEGSTILRKALCVPNDAIAIVGENTVVYVVEEGRVRLQRVRTGYATSTQTEILSGLGPGAVVVTRGKESLEDGSRIKVTP